MTDLPGAACVGTGSLRLLGTHDWHACGSKHMQVAHEEQQEGRTPIGRVFCTRTRAPRDVTELGRRVEKCEFAAPSLQGILRDGTQRNAVAGHGIVAPRHGTATARTAAQQAAQHRTMYGYNSSTQLQPHTCDSHRTACEKCWLSCRGEESGGGGYLSCHCTCA